ncbi:MAG: putative lipid II flippase FtsW [Clostridia bacterium]
MEVREFKKPVKVIEKPKQKTALKPAGRMDFPLLLAVLIISAFGLIMVFSASYYYAQSAFGDGLHYFKSQLLFLVIGIPIMLGLSKLNYKLLLKFKLHIIGLLLTVALLLLVLVIGVERNGARRWIQIGSLIPFQPSELAKFALILFMAAFMGQYPERLNSFFKSVVPMLLVMALICVPILLQPNMSMIVIIGLVGIAMMFIGGVKIKHLMLILITMIAAFVLLIVIESYRFDRILVYTDPWKNPRGDGYQIIQSLYALGSGGLFGKGLSFSHQKLLFLPYSESDFIFSIIGEELGYFFCILLMLFYLFIIYRGIKIAIKCKDKFGSLLAAGITIVMGLQVIVNMGVTMCVLPPTGQTLPFISAGGTSLFVYLAAMGVLLNISRNTT